HGEVEAAEVEQLGDAAVPEQRDEVWRALLAGCDLDHVGRAVSRRKLHDAEPVAVRVEPQCLGVDRNRLDIVVGKVGEVALVETDGHFFAFPSHAVSAARMRAHERWPLWKEERSYFSLGEWMRS